MHIDLKRPGPPAASLAAGRRSGAVLRHAFAVLVTLHLVLLFAPWQMNPPALGLDASSQQVLAHAAASGWQWGRDIMYTYGPLGYMRYPVTGDALLVPLLLWKGLLVVAFVVGVLALLRPLAFGWAAAIYAVTVVAGSLFAGGVYSMLPMLALVLYFRDAEEPPLVPVLALVIASAVYANAYYSSLVLGLFTFALMDASRAWRRRVPLFVPTFVAAALTAFLVAGQSLANAVPLVRSIVEIVSGFGDAMSQYGNAMDIVAFIAASVVVLGAALWQEWASLTDPRERIDAGLLLIGLGLFWFLTWKSGFVRHDLHSVLAWAGLAVGSGAYVASRWRPGTVHTPLWIVLLMAIVGCCVGLLRTAGLFTNANRINAAVVEALVQGALLDTPLRMARIGVDALADPREWKTGLARTNAAASASIRSATPDLRAEGTVDLVGVNQAAVLARGLNYRPQPVFQAFAAYTPWLIDRNRAHLRSEFGADTLFVSTETIDNRYPLSDMGSGFVELLTHYQAEELVGEFLRMRRRPVARGDATTDLASVDAELGDWVPVAGEGAAVMLQTQLEPSFVGRLARFALRLPQVSITVRLADGTERTHRIVPAVAANGFLLSPYTDTPAVVAAQSMGRGAAIAGKRVVAFKVDADPASARAFFEPRARVRMTGVVASGTGTETLPPALLRHFDRQDIVAGAARSVAGKGQIVEARGSTLNAHAPASPELAITGPSRVRIRYGIAEGAWTGEGRTDGVCFRIRAGGTTLYERCLLPLEHVEDRGEQQTTVRIDAAGPTTLVLETDCRANCAWDWSYWKDIDVLPAASSQGIGTAAPPHIDRKEAAAQLARSVAGKGQNVEARGTLLSAHPPSAPEITVPAVSQLRVRYGISEGAWTEGRQTDGVCFRITAVGARGNTTRLHEHCLRPVEHLEDRREQQATLAVDAKGPVRLVFETDCGGNCAWDWAYWLDIDITP